MTHVDDFVRQQRRIREERDRREAERESKALLYPKKPRPKSQYAGIGAGSPKFRDSTGGSHG